ncbi:hypothetical protein ACH6CV_14375 [Bacillota bacterium Meth-B3]
MTVEEKREYAVALMRSIKGKNTYTQGSKRNRVFATPGYGDCSSTINAVMKRVLGYGIGSRTTDQIKNRHKRKAIRLDIAIKGGVPDITQLVKGDCLYFAGNSESRRACEYVGHVEMVVGKNQLAGHGSGKGPTGKNLTTYCRNRQKAKSPTRRGNRGLICAIRWIT